MLVQPCDYAIVDNVYQNPIYKDLVTFDPASSILIAEDFILTTESTGMLNGQVGWLNSAYAPLVFKPALDLEHPGLVGNINMYSDTAYLFSSSNVRIGGGAITLDWGFYLQNISNIGNRYLFRIGFGDELLGSQNNGTYFEYSDNINGGNWVLKCSNLGISTVTNTLVPVSSGYHHAKITIDAIGSSAEFFMDGVSLGIINTNMPISSGISIFCQMQHVSGVISSGTLLLDFMSYAQILTNTR